MTKAANLLFIKFINLPNMDEKGHNGLNSSELCLSCGLCCKGLLFNRAALKPDEREIARDVALQFFPSGDGKYAFRLPCPFFKEERCSIYSIRFEACRKYRCDLLRKTANGELEFAKSMQIIARIKSIMSSISDRMASIEQISLNSDDNENFRQRIVKNLDFQCRNPMICQDAGALLREIERFLILLHDYIEKRAN